MQNTIENKERGLIKITVTVPVPEMTSFLEMAAKRLSEAVKIDGFRPGHAPYETVKSKVGEMKILEEALEDIVRKNYVKVVIDNNIEAVGAPKIDIIKAAPGNDLVFSAEVAVLPKITRLADWKKMAVAPNKTVVGDEDINKALLELQKMQTIETRANSGYVSTENDKVVVDLEIKNNGVVIEGGTGTNHAIYINEPYYIPGFSKQLVGLKEGEDKNFTVQFPKEHYQKTLAGKDVDVSVKVKEIFKLSPPELNDTFAESIGQKSLSELRELIRANIQKEKNTEESRRQESVVLEKIIKESDFEEIPEAVVNEELEKMVNELRVSVERQGGVFNDYLSAIKKDAGSLKLDMLPRAVMRIKAALVLREIANNEKILVSGEEIDAELKIMTQNHTDESIKEAINSPNYRSFVESGLINTKTINLIKSAVVSV